LLRKPAVVDAIHNGDLGALGSLLAAHRELADARIRDAKAGTRSLLRAGGPAGLLLGPAGHLGEDLRRRELPEVRNVDRVAEQTG